MAVALEQPQETVTVLRLAGDLSLQDMEGLLRVLTDMSIKGKTKVILNFRQVSHVALGGISKLTERHLRLRGMGGEIKLVGLAPYVANLFKLVGAFGYFDVVSNEDLAVARFEI
jgi:anti-sigma B factor antagonist